MIIEEMKYSSGDFRSQYCTRLLEESDIVVTNPPFSLFREFFAWLMKADKKFIIVGNQNAITYKELFPYLREDKVRLGSQTGIASMFFEVTDDMPIPPDAEKYVKAHLSEEVRNGRRITYLRTTCWFTNCDLQKHHEPLILVEKYSPDKYPKYDNYDAINVDKVKDIPCDYDGVMGVPITYMYCHNPDQFDIVALRRNPDGTVEPWTVEREREFNDTILSSLDCRNDEERRRKAQWEDYLRTNPNTEETPVDICYPYISNRAEGTNNFDLDGKETYRRITIRRKVVN